MPDPQPAGEPVSLATASHAAPPRRGWSTPEARASLRRLVLFLGVMALAALVARSVALHAHVVAALEFTAGLTADHPVEGALLFVAVSAVSAMLVFFSSVFLVPLGIEAWGETGCFLLLWAGWFLGGLVAYSIGRYFGRPVVERILSRSTMQAYERRIPRSSSFWTAFLVQLALPSDVLGYVFGLVAYPRGAYFAALLLAELPYAFGTVFLGAAFLDRQYPLLLAAAAVAVAIFAWQWWMHARRLRE